MKSLPPSPRVNELRYLVDVDPEGQEALVVYVILADEDTTPLPTREALVPIENTIRAALTKAGDWWVYFRFRSAAEQQAEQMRKGVYALPRPVSAA